MPPRWWVWIGFLSLGALTSELPGGEPLGESRDNGSDRGGVGLTACFSEHG
jgi:hypothetical protein